MPRGLAYVHWDVPVPASDGFDAPITVVSAPTGPRRAAGGVSGSLGWFVAVQSAVASRGGPVTTFYAGFQQAEPPRGNWPSPHGWLIFSRFLAGNESECRADQPDTVCVAEPHSEGGFISIRRPYRWIDEGTTHALRIRGERPQSDGSRFFALEVGSGRDPERFTSAGALRFPGAGSGDPLVTSARTTFVEIWNAGGFDRIGPEQVGAFEVTLEGMTDLSDRPGAEPTSQPATGARAGCSDRGVFPYVSLSATGSRVTIEVGPDAGPCRAGRLW